MKWEWAPRDCSDPKFMGPSGNWETAHGTCFFCQWVHVCSPSEDMLRGALRHLRTSDTRGPQIPGAGRTSPWVGLTLSIHQATW
jgi:hypothetical protein